VSSYLERAFAVMRGRGVERLSIIKDALHDIRAEDIPATGFYIEDNENIADVDRAVSI
jgi:hypothetical protein